jgi:predicted nucleotidyltransferase
MILDQMMSYVNLERMTNTELKTPPDKDVLTVAELIERLTNAVYSEVDLIKEGDFTNRKPAVTNLRRNLQRAYLQRLGDIAVGSRYAPEDARAVATLQLSSLKNRIEKLLASKVKLDTYSQAHLEDTLRRIERVLNADLTVSRP